MANGLFRFAARVLDWPRKVENKPEDKTEMTYIKQNKVYHASN